MALKEKKSDVFRIKYKNERGSKLFQFGIDDSLADDEYHVKVYGSKQKWPAVCPLLDIDHKATLHGTQSFMHHTEDGSGMMYVKCSTDSFYKLRDSY